MAKDIDTGYLDPSQSVMSAGFGDLAASAILADEDFDVDELCAEVEDNEDVQTMISLGLHMDD